MVVGIRMVSCGVLILGAVGPNAAMLLGQNTRFSFCFLATSRMLYSVPRLMFHAACGFSSPVAESTAAK